MSQKAFRMRRYSSHLTERGRLKGVCEVQQKSQKRRHFHYRRLKLHVQKKKKNQGKIRETSLVVQWLRICFAMQGTWVQSLFGELRSHKLWDSSAGAPEPWCSQINRRIFKKKKKKERIKKEEMRRIWQLGRRSKGN